MPFLSLSVCIFLLIPCGIFVQANNDSCHGMACGNPSIFKGGVEPLLLENRRKNLTFLIVSAYVTKTNTSDGRSSHINHQTYSDVNGYQYIHFNYTVDQYRHKFGILPSAWANVDAIKQLMDLNAADYFLKIDMDCLFLRTDVRLESFIDPFERYSLYTFQTTKHERFTQSNAWIIKNSQFGKLFIKEWLEFGQMGNCRDLAYEQGAFHIVIGLLLKKEYKESVSPYGCHRFCFTNRSPYKHHHCVLEWYEANGFGIKQHGGMFKSQDMYMYDFPDNFVEFDSPRDGFVCEMCHVNVSDKHSGPLLIHPCKKNHGVTKTPDEVRGNIPHYCDKYRDRT